MLKMPRIQKDKIKHCLVSAIIVLGLGQFTNPTTALITGVISFSLIKELYWDLYLGRGCPDWYDVLANTIGGTIAYIGMIVI